MTSNDEAKIGGVIISAPLWRGTPHNVLLEIVQHLSDASFHYADDSTSEWGRAAGHAKAAAFLINSRSLGFYAIECLYRHKPQLITFEQLMDRVLQDARGNL